MSKKESRILFAVILGMLCYSVYWALGYVRRFNAVHPQAQPTVYAKEPAAASGQVAVQLAPQAAAPPQAPTPRVPVSASVQTGAEAMNDDPEVDVIDSTTYNGNRKMAGITKDITRKH